LLFAKQQAVLMPKTAKSEKRVNAKVNKVNRAKYFLHYTYCLATILLLTLISININKAITRQKVLGTSINASPLQNEKSYWQKMVSDNPTYIDGYLELAKVDVELGNINEARSYIEKALSLDPNSPKITEVQKALGL
jgi:tetratricopeptide (TPR) repeat protein